MTIQLPEELERFIRAEVLAGRYSNEADVVAEAIRRLIVSQGEPLPFQTPSPLHPRKPIWEVAEELSRSIPESETRTLPIDGAAEHDHYVHGTPKHPAS